MTKILEEVVYNPGMTFAEVAKALDAPRSSVHGFIRGLLARGWLFEDNHRFYLGPAVYGLTLASGHIRAGLVTEGDLAELHDSTGLTVFLGVQAGEHLIYVAEAGSDTLVGYAARTDIRRTLLETAGGKALLVALPESQRNAYLRRRPPEDAALVDQFLSESVSIRESRIARNSLHQGSRFALATVLSNTAGEAVAEVTLVGESSDMLPREEELSQTLLRFVDGWRQRKGYSAREAV
ncbi:helix-turn-helix domain-containing protein [Microbacterium invictum]|uniref:DNA-binding IclR family transcriptional regulator n=1 Tax=Microbacterium invictum TaxID=515415 RepID=A0AA40VPE2_9MICO|nr:helix-turn-helix domain-containing protein [Microbacterium invictum]MBB4141258.1 DNA-binding IclR family transcriptional regulator [Microbacterium invictum]